MAKSKITDQMLLQAVAERGLAEASAMQQLLDQQAAAFKTQQHKVDGTAFLIDLNSNSLIVRNTHDGSERKRLALSTGRARFAADDWERIGSHTLLVQADDGNRLTEFDWQTNALYGLVISQDKTYLYNEGRLNTPFLGQTQSCLYGGVYKGKPETTPFDLFLSPSGRWLCITDRGAGTVRILNTQTLECGDPIQIRDKGSANAINLALDDAQDRAYITDNQTSSLMILNLSTGSLERERVGLGILGNLVLTPNGKHLYLITLKPNQSLVYLNTETRTADKTVKLKGDLFKANSSDACDLLSISPNGENVLIMTYLNDPNPFTPVVTVIETENAKTLRRYSLKDGVKPLQFAYGLPNPVKAYTLPLEDLLIDSALVSARELWALKRELRIQMGEDVDEDEAPPTPRAKQETEPEAEAENAEDATAEADDQDETEPEADEPVFLEIQQQILDIAVAKKDGDTGLTMTPKKANHIELPPAAVEEILDILVNTFQKQVDEDISEYEDIMLRLRQEAEKTRQELEEYDSVIVQAEALFEGKSLQTVILREAIVMMLDLKESLSKGGVKIVPTHCPNCSQPLLGSWDCQTCGFEIDNPERAMKRRIASVEATANLPRGHLVIPDPQGLRLLQLNPFKYVTWSLDPDQLSCDYPIDTLWLPNNNVLVADRDGHQILELGGKGKIFWRFDTHLSPRHSLIEPCKITYYVPEEESVMRILIVDQGNHRVLEVNKKHEILQEFGIQGVPGSEGGNLRSPSDVQYTHDRTYLIADTGNDRVVEYKADGGILNVFGKDLGLKGPTCVQRLVNDHTLIVDAGNYRLLEIDAGGQIVHETLYYNRSIDEELRVVSPIKMIRLHNKDIVIMDEDKMIQVMLEINRMTWFSRLDDLAFQPRVDEPEVFIDENGVEHRIYKVVDHGNIKPVRLSQKINFKRMQKLIEARLHSETLPQAEGDDGKSSDAANRLRALIEDRKIEHKRSLQRELTLDTFQPSEIFQKEGTDLKNFRHYVLDRHHNSVIRINRKGEVKWHYGFEMGQALSRPFHLSETKRTLLIADTGNNRVLELSKADKEIIVEFKGPPDSPLSGPRSAVRLPLAGRTLIADQRNKRIVELNARGEISWEFSKSGQISSPQYVEETESGHILFTDSMLNSVRELDRDGNLRWSYGSRIKGNGPGQLFAPEFATRLSNGHTLIADTRNNRVVEVNLDGREVWMFGHEKQKRKIMNPTQAERLENGNTLITFNNHRELIEVTPSGETVWFFKMGNDVFLPPVHGDGRHNKQMVEKITPYYNPIEKRLIRSAEEKAMWGMEAHITLMENCQMKSVRASLVLMALERSGTVVKTFPSPEELLADKFGKHLIIAVIMDPGSDPEAIVDDVRYIAEIEDAQINRIELEEPQAVAAV
ncbi:MAG: PQQ-binding-like beta-propeller repeat protein [Candidatus Sericytochromatia bacterium]